MGKEEEKKVRIGGGRVEGRNYSIIIIIVIIREGRGKGIIKEGLGGK